MQATSLEEIMLHKHMSPCNEIVHRFYAHLQPTMGHQPPHSIVKNRKIPFMREDILWAIPIPDVAEEEPSFSDRVNEI